MKETRKAAKDIAKAVDTTSLPDLHTGHTPVEKKVQAAAAYLMEGGNTTRAAKIAGVHPNSVFNWKRESWWHSLQARLKSEFAEDLRARLGQMAGKALDVVEDRLENGDRIMNYKTGEMETKPLPGKEAAWIFGVIHDKQRVMENLPISISENKSEDERLTYLMERFEEMSRERNAKIIEGEASGKQLEQ